MYRSGFKQFSRKVEGDDNFLETEGTGGWLTTRYALLYELGTGRISWNDYCRRVYWLPSSERQTLSYERERLGIPIRFDCTMGVHQPLRIRLEQASEPEQCYQGSEQQEGVQTSNSIGGVVPSYVDNYNNLIREIERAREWYASAASDSSRSR